MALQRGNAFLRSCRNVRTLKLDRIIMAYLSALHHLWLLYTTRSHQEHLQPRSQHSPSSSHSRYLCHLHPQDELFPNPHNVPNAFAQGTSQAKRTYPGPSRGSVQERQVESLRAVSSHQGQVSEIIHKHESSRYLMGSIPRRTPLASQIFC